MERRPLADLRPARLVRTGVNARLDVHRHPLPDFYREALKSVGADGSGGAELPAWSLEADLALMEDQGIAGALLSFSSPGVFFGEPGFARDLARRCNDFLAESSADHPGRLGGLAILPLPDVEASLTEIARALDDLRLDGVILQASYGAMSLASPALEPVFAELGRRGAVALIHPTTPPGADAPKPSLPPFALEFVFDTTRAAAGLLLSGSRERHPDVEIILAHAGGTLPYLAARLEMVRSVAPQAAEGMTKPADELLRGFHYDTAISTAPATLDALRATVPASRILFGTDHPYLDESLCAGEIAALADDGGWGEGELAAVERGNAAALFPRLAGGSG